MIIGEKKVDESKFVTSRCSYIGSFVLAYTRSMVHEIIEIACPNRYNAQGIDEQPFYGDTDSLVFREWQAALLIRAGWVKKESGKLTDELADDKSHWFLPARFEATVKELAEAGKSMPVQQDWVWEHATEAEKRDPANFYFWRVNRAIFSSPKSYVCQYENNDGSKTSDKLKFKGIPTSALVEGSKMSFGTVEHAYEKALIRDHFVKDGDV